MSEAEAALADAARAGIHRLAIPTPFIVGRVNCYLIEDEPLTLIDTGPNSGKSLDELERGLASLGHAIEELELIVISHQHMDHLGLLEVLARRSGAEVAAFAPLRGYLADFSANATADDEFAEQVMLRHGVPAELATVLRSVGSAFRAFGSGGTVGRPLRDGDTLELRDRRLQVLHRPGHSPSDLVFWDEARSILIAADHLLARISSNPLISRPLVRADDQADNDPAVQPERPQALLRYLASMTATRELPARLVLTGHGDPVLDHRSLIDERFRLHARRARKIRRMLEPGPASAYDLALQIWGNIAVTQAYLTLSEVIGHLDLLVRDGEVVELAEDDVVRFAAA